MTEKQQSWERRDWYLAAAIFFGTLLSRIPFRTTLLYAWDSVLYTRALEHFDVTIHQPQPPGHIYYVGLVWLVNRVLDDPNASMVWISVFAAAAAPVALFWLGKAMFSRQTGTLAALLLATSTSFWAYSEVAYPYTLLCLLSVVSAFTIYRLWEGKSSWVIPASLTLGLAAGFRADLLFFLLPLFVVGIARKGWRNILLAGALLSLTTAAWYVPAALLSGGLAAFREASDSQSDYLFTYFSVFGKGWEALGSNLRTLLRFNLWGLAAAIPLLALFFSLLPGRIMHPVLRDRRFWFLAVWTVPSLAFYIFIHIGEFGYIFTYLPALLLVAAWGLGRFVSAHAKSAGGQSWGRVFAIVSSGLVAINLLLFLALPTPLSASRLAARDDILRCRIDTIKENFDPSSTVVVSVFDYEIATYYLPGYHHWRFDQAIDTHPVTGIDPGIKTVVVFEEFLKPEDLNRARVIDICREQRLFYLPVNGSRSLWINWDARVIGIDDEA